ncbi:rhodanese-like domain-containing protein [Paenibacillus beijingensis]|uniref:Sulfurtransferase n=1 Tax=Paenibacillus beijingensis TaxID=1126833 RepID=A0A0D5NQE5_9BACL|nr:rhodanese-like domain-containing protein [Paenibacillus beijingensis]AJY77202.1 sulfurtransferase [Paenibacillus beijingensis]
MERWKSVFAENLLSQLSAGEITADQIIDVREAEEWDYYHLEGTKLIPMNTVPHCLGDLDDNKSLYIICAHGVRSEAVCRYLSGQGYDKLYNVEGGMAAVAHLQGFQYD